MEPMAEIGEGVVVQLPPGRRHRDAAAERQRDARCDGQFHGGRVDAPLTYRWRLNGRVIAAQPTPRSLSPTFIPATPADMSSKCAIPSAPRWQHRRAHDFLSAEPAGVPRPDGVLHAVGTDGSERIYVRPNPANSAQVEVVQVDGSGAPSGSQVFPLAAITGLDFDLGPGSDELVIGLVLPPLWKVTLDTGSGDGMLIADERGLPVPKRSDGIVDFPQLSAAFAPC
jgi:hypothetical protein